MNSEKRFPGFDESDFRALSAVLAAIPAPRMTKDPKRIGRQSMEPAKHVPLRAVLDRMRGINPVSQRGPRDSAILLTALILLDAMGAIEVTENQTLAAMTEAAGHLLHSISHFLGSCATGQYCYRPVRLDPQEVELSKRPFLILARQAEEHRIAWAARHNKRIEPIREHQITSVLIKGERKSPTAISRREHVYLHVWNAGWNAYTLIGSGCAGDENPEDTAVRALKEDLDIPRDEEVLQQIVLRPSGVEDRLVEAYSPTRGAQTRYRFNLFWAEKINGRLAVREELRPRWFTFEELCRQEATSGESIITNAELIQSIDHDSVPVAVTDVAPFATPLSTQFKDLIGKIGDVRKALGQLARSVGLMVLSYKLWLLLLVGMVLVAVVVLPRVGLGPVADAVGIAAFLAWLVGLIIKRSRQRM